MGQTQTTSMKSVTDVLNQSTTNILQKTINESSASCNIKQTIDFQNYGNIKCKGNLNIGNNATALCEMSSVFQNKSSTDIQNVMKTALSQTMSSNNQMVQGFLGGLSQQNQSTNTDIENRLRNVIENTITNEVVNTCLAESNPDQFIRAINYKNIDVGGNCNFTNETQVKVLANCFTDVVLNSSLAASQFSDVDVKAAVESAATQKGADDTIKAFIDGIAGPIKVIIIAIVIVIVIAVIGVAYVALSPAGQESITKLSESKTNR